MCVDKRQENNQPDTESSSQFDSIVAAHTHDVSEVKTR